MNVTIVGAGQSGAWVAQRLREKDKECSITLIGEELWAPYERPPLSKKVITANSSEPQFILSKERAEGMNIRMLLGTSVLTIDRDKKCVETREHGKLQYDKLVLATGGRARRLSGIDPNLPGVHYLRTWEDAICLRESLQSAGSLLVIGGGWIGLEVAASARSKGCKVTLVEAAERLCARSVTTSISDFLAKQHSNHGVSVLLSNQISSIDPDVTGGLLVRTSKGSISADLIVAGIGLEPNVDLAISCGLEVSNGIVVNAQGTTSDPDIYATGDVANQPLPEHGRRIRYESYANATNHAIAVADCIAGQPTQESDIPWFWSDQFDFQLQVLGQPTEEGEWIKRGSDSDSKFCLFQLLNGQLNSAIAINMAKEIKIAKRWMKSRQLLCPTILSDSSVRLEKI